MKTPLLYIDHDSCQGSHQGGWTRPIRGNPLTQPQDLLDQLANSLDGNKLSLLLPDAQLHPLRITLEEKVKASELPNFLTWKLKRFLPYPPDQTVLRYLPLAEPNTYLTFTLHRPWVESLTAGFKQQGIHCGFIGGIFSTLLENRTELRNKANLCIFRDLYLLAVLDERGHWLDFRSRRLPFADEDGQTLDVKTLVEQDLANPLQQASKDVVLINLEPSLEMSCRDLGATLSQHGYTLQMPSLTGTSLSRFQNLNSKGVTP